jgi:hypothetical protein
MHDRIRINQFCPDLLRETVPILGRELTRD